MITDNTVKTSGCYKTTNSRICWSAIIAGAFVGVGLGFLLNLFAVAIGLSAYSSSSTGASAVAIGGIIGLLIGVIVSMGAAGFVAGYFSRFYHCFCHDGVTYGFITWSLALILSALLILPVSQYVSFYEDSLSSNPTIEVSSEPAVKATAKSKAVSASATVEPKHLAWSGWILFILFFVGAFSSCIGACCGMRCKCGDDTTTPPPSSPEISKF